jgi:hypothetical protein
MYAVGYVSCLNVQSPKPQPPRPSKRAAVSYLNHFSLVLNRPVLSLPTEPWTTRVTELFSRCLLVARPRDAAVALETCVLIPSTTTRPTNISRPVHYSLLALSLDTPQVMLTALPYESNSHSYCLQYRNKQNEELNTNQCAAATDCQFTAVPYSQCQVTAIRQQHCEQCGLFHRAKCLPIPHGFYKNV